MTHRSGGHQLVLRRHQLGARQEALREARRPARGAVLQLVAQRHERAGQLHYQLAVRCAAHREGGARARNSQASSSDEGTMSATHSGRGCSMSCLRRVLQHAPAHGRDHAVAREADAHEVAAVGEADEAVLGAEEGLCRARSRENEVRRGAAWNKRGGSDAERPVRPASGDYIR